LSVWRSALILVTTAVDEFFELGERELPFRLFLVLWSPALVGGLVGGLYNEIMHGSPLFIALLKIARRTLRLLCLYISLALCHSSSSIHTLRADCRLRMPTID
jgi:hypothetical protein